MIVPPPPQTPVHDLNRFWNAMINHWRILYKEVERRSTFYNTTSRNVPETEIPSRPRLDGGDDHGMNDQNGCNHPSFEHPFGEIAYLAGHNYFW